jgi:hypothetical protein
MIDKERIYEDPKMNFGGADGTLETPRKIFAVLTVLCLTSETIYHSCTLAS